MTPLPTAGPALVVVSILMMAGRRALTRSAVLRPEGTLMDSGVGAGVGAGVAVGVGGVGVGVGPGTAVGVFSTVSMTSGVVLAAMVAAMIRTSSRASIVAATCVDTASGVAAAVGGADTVGIAGWLVQARTPKRRTANIEILRMGAKFIPRGTRGR